MLMELIPLIGGGVFGAVVKLFSMSMDNKAKQHEMLIQMHQKRQASIDAVNEVAGSNVYFAWTRRVLAIAVTAMVGSLIFLPYADPDITVNVANEVVSGRSYLFGLIDTRRTVEVWTQLNGIVFHPIAGNAFLTIIGVYFGASICDSGRRR